MDSELKQNLARIIRTLEGQGMKPNKISKAIGYAATRQLDNTIEGKSMLSIKAVRGLINKLKVNPTYLFLGKGDMFLPDESELEALRKEKQEWIQRHNEAVKTVMALYEIIKKLEKKNDDLIELSSAALKYQNIKTDKVSIDTSNGAKSLSESSFLSTSNDEILKRILDDLPNPQNDVINWLKFMQKDWVDKNIIVDTDDAIKKKEGKQKK